MVKVLIYPDSTCIAAGLIGFDALLRDALQIIDLRSDLGTIFERLGLQGKRYTTAYVSSLEGVPDSSV